MLIDLAKRHTNLGQWFSSPAGDAVCEAMLQQIKPYQRILHGENLLQIGCFPENPWLDNLPYRSKWLLSPDQKIQKQSLSSSFSQLPFDRSSVNTIIAPLTLNLLHSNSWPLDALDRILKPMGYLVIIAINPLSFWGAGLRLGILPGFSGKALAGMGAFNLQRRLEQKGYTQYHLEYFHYLPPVSSSFLLKKLSFLDTVGQMFPLYPAAFYTLIMQKYEPVTPNPMVYSTRQEAASNPALA